VRLVIADLLTSQSSALMQNYSQQSATYNQWSVTLRLPNCLFSTWDHVTHFDRPRTI